MWTKRTMADQSVDETSRKHLAGLQLFKLQLCNYAEKKKLTAVKKKPDSQQNRVEGIYMCVTFHVLYTKPPKSNHYLGSAFTRGKDPWRVTAVSGRSDPKLIRPRSFRPKAIQPHLKLNTFELKYTSVYHFKCF